ncbi:NERD domain-containing protein [Sporolactobacillus shoreae]|uniref:NERD domain-containing protein n=1 Tax=Sporolactobacillus shoreae TaxID=1465501 RepID=A0A4Z0GLD7_9BACL|nr:nuclease-related domain-containing protein [Sporolactobacillus shoreae]TGA97772.1 NERD domain-containing protein [Sporolactobacillus shoreae]
MIIKKRNTPRILHQLQSLKCRISIHHSQYTEIKKNELRRFKGFNGEKAIDYYLSELPGDRYFIFHGLRLPLNDNCFQMDTLILTQYFLLIIEIKNIAGTIYFDPVFHQMIRTWGEKEEGFSDPITQAQLQKTHLARWMVKYHLPRLPIEFFVAVSSPSTIIKTSPGDTTVPQKVCHMHQIPEKIQSMTQVYPKETITLADRKKIEFHFTKYHTPPKIDILKEYQIDPDELITGVHCPQCSAIPMKRIPGAWHCQSCGCVSNNAHIKALFDYFLIVSTTITIEEFQRWTHLESHKTASRLLNELNLPVSGNNRCKIFHQPIGFDDD